jgi:hypothetical protein
LRVAIGDGDRLLDQATIGPGVQPARCLARYPEGFRDQARAQLVPGRGTPALELPFSILQ